VISAAENSNKFQKTRFWNEKSVENVLTLEGLPFNSSMISFHIWLFKKLIQTLQKNVHMLSFLFGNGFTPVLDSSHPLAENWHLFSVRFSVRIGQ
jgi:hypothetical protein